MARAVLIAASASGQGKTTVTAALARKLRREGKRVCVFKAGPDFIDPIMLARASGAPVHTLDLWMVGREECRRLLVRAAETADAILIEGVMGLYDGTPSAADLAIEFGLPVLAVIDTGAMAQTAGALVHGLRDYGPVSLVGVIANRVATERHNTMIATSLRDIPLLGSLPKQIQSLPERHLGLVLPDEQSDIDDTLDALADQLKFDFFAWNALPPMNLESVTNQHVVHKLSCCTVAVARDPAFAFIYPANIDTLVTLGAQIVWFSPLADEPVPAGADAVYLPGGYPELYAEELANATCWRASIQAAHKHGVPIVAECGGMMSIAESITGNDGKTWPMASLLPGAVVMQSRPAGLGRQALPTSRGTLRGHTFHYSRLENGLEPAMCTIKHPSGAQGESVYVHGSLWASYFHAYFASNLEATAALFLRRST